MVELDGEDQGCRLWWCVVDYCDDDPANQFALLQTGWADSEGILHKHRQNWLIPGDGASALYAEYSDIQYGECPFPL